MNSSPGKKSNLMVVDTRAEIGKNLQRVLDVIAQTVMRSGRKLETVKLVAVSKTVSVEKIRQALELGITCLGENKVQEGQSKKAQLGGYSYEFHLIGSLQKNKVNKAVAAFDWIESVDSFDLAKKIDQACISLKKVMPVLLQLNMGDEPTKSGAKEEELFELVGQVLELRHLSVRGLMAIPPFLENPEEVRPYFRRLRELAEGIQRAHLGNIEMKELSMGMSHDYPIAIEEGATIVRLGTAIFGERQSR
jgi:pyridoxal phosphate enzyme (YggS family)